MHLLLFIFLAVFPFGQLIRIEVTPTVTIHLLDLLVGGIGLFWLVRSAKRGKFSQGRLGWMFLSFGLIAAFSLLLGAIWVKPDQALVGSLYLVRWLGYLLLYFAVWQEARAKQFASRLLESLSFVGIVIVTLGFGQYILFPDIRPLSKYGWDPHYYRLVGTFLDAGFAGILLVLFTLLSFSRIDRRVGQGKSIALAAAGLVATALTFSRASYLALAAGLLTFYIVRRNAGLVGAASLLFLGTVLVAPKPSGEGVNLSRTSTVAKRIDNYDQALQTLKSAPLFGVGFNLYRYRRFMPGEDSQVLHSGASVASSVLFVLATTGIAGFVSYAAVWWSVLSLGWRGRRKVAGTALLCSSAALLVHSVFDNSLFYPWVMGWMGILLSVADDSRAQ